MLKWLTFHSAIVPSLLERFVHVISWRLVSLAWFNCLSFLGCWCLLSFFDRCSLSDRFDKSSIIELINLGQFIFLNEVDQVFLGQMATWATRLHLCQLYIVVLDVKPS